MRFAWTLLCAFLMPAQLPDTTCRLIGITAAPLPPLYPPLLLQQQMPSSRSSTASVRLPAELCTLQSVPLWCQMSCCLSRTSTWQCQICSKHTAAAYAQSSESGHVQGSRCLVSMRWVSSVTGVAHTCSTWQCQFFTQQPRGRHTQQQTGGHLRYKPPMQSPPPRKLYSLELRMGFSAVWLLLCS
jgi:hypothetical protein